MAQQVTGKGTVRTFRAGETLTANAVVTFMTAGAISPFIRYWQTDTQHVLGIAMQSASTTGESIDVLLGAPTVKLLANASISAGAIVGPATDAAGRIMERGQAATTTAQVPVIGIALETAGATNVSIEVLLEPFSTNLQSA